MAEWSQIAPYSGVDYNPVTGRYETRVRSRLNFFIVAGVLSKRDSRTVCEIAMMAGSKVAMQFARAASPEAP